METRVPTQIEQTLDHNSLLMASIILRDVNQPLTGIQTIVSMVLRYVAVGLAIPNRVMGLIAPTTVEEK